MSVYLLPYYRYISNASSWYPNFQINFQKSYLYCAVPSRFDLDNVIKTLQVGNKTSIHSAGNFALRSIAEGDATRRDRWAMSRWGDLLTQIWTKGIRTESYRWQLNIYKKVVIKVNKSYSLETISTFLSLFLE